MAELHLFSTDTELKDFLPMTAGEILDQILSFVGDAEQKFIVPIIGQSQFDALNSYYNNGAGTGNSNLDSLLSAVRKPLAAFTMMLYIPHGQILVSPSGLRIASTDTHKTAFKWQIEELTDAYFELACNRKEELIKWLNARLSTYTTYRDSDEFDNNLQFLVNYASEFDQYHKINNSRAAYDSCVPAIRDIELLQVREAISEEYYDELIGKIRASNTNADDEIILPWLQAAVVKLAVAEAVKRNIAQLTARGILTFSSDSSSRTGGENILAASGDNDKSNLVRTCELYGNAYINKVRDYLNANASATKYATFFASDQYTDPATVSELLDDGTANPDFVAPPFRNDQDGAKVFMV